MIPEGMCPLYKKYVDFVRSRADDCPDWFSTAVLAGETGTVLERPGDDRILNCMVLYHIAQYYIV